MALDARRRRPRRPALRALLRAQRRAARAAPGRRLRGAARALRSRGRRCAAIARAPRDGLPRRRHDVPPHPRLARARERRPVEPAPGALGRRALPVGAGPRVARADGRPHPPRLRHDRAVPARSPTSPATRPIGRTRSAARCRASSCAWWTTTGAARRRARSGELLDPVARRDGGLPRRAGGDARGRSRTAGSRPAISPRIARRRPRAASWGARRS